MDFPLRTLHANRHPIERRNLLPMIHAWDAVANDPSDGTEAERERYYQQSVRPIEDKIIETFPRDMSEEDVFNIVLREQSWERTISGWQDTGAAIFHFSSPLLAKLNKTDVMDLPVQSIRLPYDVVYVSFSGEIFPSIDGEFEIDGMYLSSGDHLPQFLKDSFKNDDAVWAEANELRASSSENILRQCYEIYGVRSFEDYVQACLTDNARARDSYHRFCADPDEWYANDGAEKWSIYWSLLVDFSFRSKTKKAGPWSSTYIASEPHLRAEYRFPTHRSTVRNAIEDGIANGLPTETFREDIKHPNDLRNVVSSPEHLEEVTRLIFNVICYLNWPERDEITRFNSDRVQARIDRQSTRSKREKATSRAQKEGYRVIHFCGLNNTEANASSQPSGSTVASHWRRGHWRNQRYGKALEDTKLVWIAPTLVKSEQQTDDIVTTVYNTSAESNGG